MDQMMPRHSPGARPNDTPLSIQMARSWQGGANVVDDEAALRPVREGFDVRNRVTAAMDAVEPAVGAEAIAKAFQPANRPFAWVRAPSNNRVVAKMMAGLLPCRERAKPGRAHDQNLRQRAGGFGDQHHDLIATLDHLVFVPGICRSLADEACGANRAYPWP